MWVLYVSFGSNMKLCLFPYFFLEVQRVTTTNSFFLFSSFYTYTLVFFLFLQSFQMKPHLLLTSLQHIMMLLPW